MWEYIFFCILSGTKSQTRKARKFQLWKNLSEKNPITFPQLCSSPQKKEYDVVLKFLFFLLFFAFSDFFPPAASQSDSSSMFFNVCNWGFWPLSREFPFSAFFGTLNQPENLSRWILGAGGIIIKDWWKTFWPPASENLRHRRRSTGKNIFEILNTNKQGGMSERVRKKSGSTQYCVA